MFKTKIQNIFSRRPGALCSFFQGGQKIKSYATQRGDRKCGSRKYDTVKNAKVENAGVG